MDKLDLAKKYKACYTAKTNPGLVNIEPAQFLSISGKGDPSGPGFSENIQALYATAYTVKFIYKAEGKDFVVSKLEGLWWFDEERFGKHSLSEAPAKVPRNEWEYRLLVRLPDYVSKKEISNAVQVVVEKKKKQLTAKIELSEISEGLSVQALHTGSFATEPQTLEKITDFMKQNELERNGVHHEIYLSDFNKTEPSKLKTILREPVKQKNLRK